MTKPEPPDSTERFFLQDASVLWQRLGSEPLPQILEHVYLDTSHPSLSFTGFVRGRRTVSSSAEPPFLGDELYDLEHRPSAALPIEKSPRRVAFAEIAATVAEATGLRDLLPWFGIRYQRQRVELDGLCVDVDSGLTYYSLFRDEPFCVGRETAKRVTMRARERRTAVRTNAKGKPKRDRRVEELLGELPRSPNTTKKWMGFFLLQRCYEIPRHNELAGFEFEAKLDVETLDIDVGRLAFPVIEVHQSDSLRSYYQHYRASIRGEMAQIVEKGPAQSIGGVLKRREGKRKGLSPFDMPDPQMIMRRYKREVKLVSPDSSRVYTLSLHHCDAGKTLHQLEIEYDGRLIPGAATEMARFRLDHDTRHFLVMATRADAAGCPMVGNELRTRYLDLTPSALDRDVVLATMVKPPDVEEEPALDPVAECQVIDDMLLLRDSLLRQGRSRPSRVTKRGWLRKVYEQG